MAGTVNVTFTSFFSPSRIERLFPEALEALIGLAFRTGLDFTAKFHQIRTEDHPEVYQGIELWVCWGDERFAAIYCVVTKGQETIMARDCQFSQGQPDRQLPWLTKEEGVAILAMFLEPLVSKQQKLLGQRHQTLEELKKLRRQVTAA